ncbi:SGNH/GDSL hydrolase family protein [Herbidospora yilanensis]|uniref:SGNH/GDSL hydrolase family protein n=1 Tax=Herbidospora yilanensis TaxID=354426 RepID=UPI000785AAE2|nr:SGNH/GDSL hydrolase family protein [Herbidospora yilanensis]
MTYLRYVAIGDSQTEGLNDGDESSGYRGWADRLAEHLAAGSPDVLYANLAVRGRLAARIRAEQVGPALALKPDLVSVMAGMNDIPRPGSDPAVVAGEVEEMVRAFTATGATVLTFTFPNIAEIAPIARRFLPKVLDFNDRLREASRRHGAVLVDTFPYPVSTDARLWSRDRLHAAPLGHERIAAAAAHALGLPGSDLTWTGELRPIRRPNTLLRTGAEVRWAAAFLGPWVIRRIRGRSSGDGRTAKRPALLPVIPRA